MKLKIPTPAVIAALVVVLAGVGVWFFRGASGESTAPKPDPARFLPPNGGTNTPGTSR